MGCSQLSFTEIKKLFFKHRQPIAWTVVALWALFIFMMSSMPSTSLPTVPAIVTSLAHFMEYWLLAIFLVGALDVPWRKSWIVAVAAMVIASLCGIVDEYHQLFVPGRICDTLDWLVDTGGGTLGSLVGTWFLMMYRMWRGNGKHPDEN